MLELHHENVLTLETLVDKMCHTPADLFHISQRGYIREGYWADLVLVNPRKPHQVNADNIRYKCGWSPMEGQTFRSSVTHTLVNGQIVYENGHFTGTQSAARLAFNT
jgi:dihydroorotase